MPGQNETRVFVTDQDNDVTTTIAGADGYQTIFDLSPGTDIYYWLLEHGHGQLGRDGDLRIRLQLPQEGGMSTEIGDNAKIRLVARGPESDDTPDKIGRIYRYREFSNADQFNSEEVLRISPNQNIKITEGAHLELQVDNSTNNNDVDLSQQGGFVELEAIRGTK